MSSVHDGKKQFNCNICGYSSFYMRKHVSLVHEGGKRIKCEMCDKSVLESRPIFNNPIASIHEEIKGFKCKMCEKNFSYKSNMEKHMTSIHERKQAFNL